jgi:hypothetical protein
MESKMLTEEERHAIRLAGELSTYITNNIIGHGETRDQDVAELESDIHRIQYKLRSQSTARLYPGEFRLMGEVIDPDG